MEADWMPLIFKINCIASPSTAVTETKVKIKDKTLKWNMLTAHNLLFPFLSGFNSGPATAESNETMKNKHSRWLFSSLCFIFHLKIAMHRIEKKLPFGDNDNIHIRMRMEKSRFTDSPKCILPAVENQKRKTKITDEREQQRRNYWLLFLTRFINVYQKSFGIGFGLFSCRFHATDRIGFQNGHREYFESFIARTFYKLCHLFRNVNVTTAHQSGLC